MKVATSRALSALAIGAVILTAGCPADETGPTPANAVAELPPCLQGEPFIADGDIPVDAAASGDAVRVSGFQWESYEGCERLVIDLVGDGDAGAATVGAVSAEVLRHLGVVRIDMREVEWVDPEASEERFEGDLVRAAYSVWSPDGRWTYVDVHLSSAAEAHVSTLGNPARVVVDLQSGGGPVPPAPPEEGLVVVLEPRPGPTTYPLQVSGYARTFEANVVLRLEHEGEEILEDFTTATSWADAWGHFSFTVDQGPEGPLELHVGEYSAKDGSWQGVTVELQMAGGR